LCAAFDQTPGGQPLPEGDRVRQRGAAADDGAFGFDVGAGRE
jgi:hypothetical protein